MATAYTVTPVKQTKQGNRGTHNCILYNHFCKLKIRI